MVSDLVYDLYSIGALNGFDRWAVEQSVQDIGLETSDCQVVHVDGDVWERGASEAEDVKVDAEENKLFNFYNCDRNDQLERYALLGCEASRTESHGQNDDDDDDDDYMHYGTATLS